jgi:hypothetical protein
MEKRKNVRLAKLVRIIAVCLFLNGLALLLLSCATNFNAYAGIDDAVSQNDFEAGINTIKKGQETQKRLYPEKNTISLYLDKGLLEHYAGNYVNSSNDLQEAERFIQEAFTKSITAGIASYVANDNTKEYAGEDFEDIYLNVFNALNYYNRGNTEGALVEIRKLSISSGKLDMLSRKYEDVGKSAGDWLMERLGVLQFVLSPHFFMENPDLFMQKPMNFSNSALARYLGALFYLGDRNTDSARIEFDQLRQAFANTNIYKNSIPNAVADAQNVPLGKARLNIFGFSGLSPVKKEETFISHFPFFSHRLLQYPVLKLPVLVDRPSAVSRIEVVVDKNKFNLELLEDMGAVIKETYNAKFSKLFFKTYIRVLLKYAGAEIGANQIAQKAGDFAAAASILAAKIAADASEGADIRMSRYMPDKVYIGGINLDPGTYTVTVNYYSGIRIIASYEYGDVNIRINSLNLIESFCLQ